MSLATWSAGSAPQLSVSSRVQCNCRGMLREYTFDSTDGKADSWLIADEGLRKQGESNFLDRTTPRRLFWPHEAAVVNNIRYLLS
jgi:hypothetical protein